MCCLFGLIDTELRFTGKEKSKMLHALASASEARGTDATGVAYDYSRTLHIYKRPIPGHKLNFYLRNDTRFAMGHTRMTTQGIARRNYNNHPPASLSPWRRSPWGRRTPKESWKRCPRCRTGPQEAPAQHSCTASSTPGPAPAPCPPAAPASAKVQAAAGRDRPQQRKLPPGAGESSPAADTGPDRSPVRRTR